MSKRSRGGKRGGGGTNVNVVSETSLISARETNRAQVDQVLDVFSDFGGEYGTQVNDIGLVTLKGRSKTGVLAYYDGTDSISFNDHFFNGNIEKAYKDSVDMGFHPNSGSKTGLQATAAHELGHKLTADVAVKMGKTRFSIDSAAKEIVEKARKDTGHKGVIKLAEKISGYATYSNAEAIAEAVCDVYCNGGKAKKESIAIVKVIDSYLK